MAELILTEEEKKLPFWTDLDDASLGKAVKAKCFWLLNHPLPDDNNYEGKFSLLQKAALVGMCCILHERRADKAEFQLMGVTDNGRSIGDWHVVYKKVEKFSFWKKIARKIRNADFVLNVVQWSILFWLTYLILREI
jgi:hypothetical protein